MPNSSAPQSSSPPLPPLPAGAPGCPVPGLNAFVDISHWQQTVDLDAAHAAGLVGMMHKATQGASFVDPTWAARARKARELGLLIGAYHLCTNQLVEDQIDRFLDTIATSGSSAGVVPVLDWQHIAIPSQGTMTQTSLVEMINQFHDRTGIYPMLYCGYWALANLAPRQGTGTLRSCPLWQGFYSSHFGWLSDIWDDWTMLQYTDGTLGPSPHEFPGLGTVARDTFNGTLENARNFWAAHALRK
ncbi:glycoside hydrolase family 25 protein [Roseateles sp. L2-2]|uniref:glycoside hydrolase family 25 protein n=1 Tax=Roseateles sp. L2-2 TaxID=3422597 RepID=UPI003D36A640